jgi:hypothetical protein
MSGLPGRNQVGHYPPVSTRSAASRIVIGVLLAVVLALSVALLTRSRGDSTAVPSARADLHTAIEQEIQKETGGLNSEPAVDAYLDRLERRARQQGKVTAVEIEPGFVAIQRLDAALGSKRVLEKQAQFSGRMERLQQELGVLRRDGGEP